MDQSLMTADEHSEQAIAKRLADNPEIAYRIIGDMYDIVLAEQERAAGIKRMGRRPKPNQVPLSQVWGTLFPPPYSHDPFPQLPVPRHDAGHLNTCSDVDGCICLPARRVA